MTLPTFIAWEAVQVANEGGRVLILATQPKQVIADLLNSGASELARTVRQANGNEGIDFPSGGTIQIHWDAYRLRGYTASLAVIPIGTSKDDLMSVLPSLATTGGDVVGYY